MRGHMPCAVLFRRLDLLPVGPDLIDILHLDIAENMRMAAYQLVRDLPRHALEIERAALARQLAMKNHLQEQVAQFFRHFVVVAAVDGVDQFIDFLDGVKAQ